MEKAVMVLCFAGFVDGVDEFAVGMDDDPGGIRRCRGEALGVSLPVAESNSKA